MKHNDKGDRFKVDIALDTAKPADFDALVLPGGVVNADDLRTYPQAVSFVKAFFGSAQAGCRDLPCAVDTGRSRCCEGTDSDLMAFAANRHSERGRRMGGSGSGTGRPLTTSRKPDDIPSFNRQLLEAFAS